MLVSFVLHSTEPMASEAALFCSCLMVLSSKYTMRHFDVIKYYLVSLLHHKLNMHYNMDSAYVLHSNGALELNFFHVHICRPV